MLVISTNNFICVPKYFLSVKLNFCLVYVHDITNISRNHSFLYSLIMIITIILLSIYYIGTVLKAGDTAPLRCICSGLFNEVAFFYHHDSPALLYNTDSIPLSPLITLSTSEKLVCSILPRISFDLNFYLITSKFFFGAFKVRNIICHFPLYLFDVIFLRLLNIFALAIISSAQHTSKSLFSLLMLFFSPYLFSPSFKASMFLSEKYT